MSENNDTLTLTDVADAALTTARTVIETPAVGPAPGPPPDLTQILAEAVATFAAAKAGGKTWYLSKGMWGALGSLVGGLSVLILPAIHSPAWGYTAAGAVTVLFATLAAHGRATASGPIR